MYVPAFSKPQDGYGGPGTWPNLEKGLQSRFWFLSGDLNNGVHDPFGYQYLNPSANALYQVGFGYYPTLHTLDLNGSGWTRLNISFSRAATLLQRQVDRMLSKTYAKRVNLIAHSKGTLISRAFLAQSPANYGKVKLLVMAQGPHSGSPLAYQYRNQIPILSRAIDDVKNLQPTYPTVYHSYLGGTPKLMKVLNKELEALNRKVLVRSRNSGVNYQLVYSQTSRLPVLFRFSRNPISDSPQVIPDLFMGVDSDEIVPAFSQLGKSLVAKWDSKKKEFVRKADEILPAFEDLYQEASARRKDWITEIGLPHEELTESEEFSRYIWNQLKLPIPADGGPPRP